MPVPCPSETNALARQFTNVVVGSVLWTCLRGRFPLQHGPASPFTNLGTFDTVMVLISQDFSLARVMRRTWISRLAKGGDKRCPVIRSGVPSNTRKRPR